MQSAPGAVRCADDDPQALNPAAAGARPIYRAAILLLFILAQLLLALHQLEHRSEFSTAGSPHACGLCHFASELAPAPEPIAIAPPAILARASLPPAAEWSLPRQALVTGFQSRAPPPLRSV